MMVCCQCAVWWLHCWLHQIHVLGLDLLMCSLRSVLQPSVTEVIALTGAALS
jgi:hypothetical protein